MQLNSCYSNCQFVLIVFIFSKYNLQFFVLMTTPALLQIKLSVDDLGTVFTKYVPIIVFLS